MLVTVNDITVNFPTSLADITLGQRIDFHNEYGIQLEEMTKKIIETDEGWEKEILLSDYHDFAAAAFVAFFANITIEAVKEYYQADVVMSLYYSIFPMLSKEESEITLIKEVSFNGEMWYLQSPQLMSSQHRLTFGELIDAKQTLKDMANNNGSRWDFVHRACCIFLRKKDEQYDPSMLEPESERSKLMLQLPLDIALAVGFFLTSSINLYKNTLVYSKQGKAEGATLQNTSTSGDGYTS